MKPCRYDPIVNPLDLPVRVGRISCQLVQPTRTESRGYEGASHALAKGFKRAVHDCLACRTVREGGQCPETEPNSRGVCPSRERCGYPVMYAPRLEDGHAVPRPVFLFSEALQKGHVCGRFELEVVLWGRHSLGLRNDVEKVLDVLASRGFSGGAEDRFEVRAWRWSPGDSLRHWTNRFFSGNDTELTLELVTPFQLLQARTLGDGRRVRRLWRGHGFPLAEILGNCAYNTTRWDLWDRDAPDVPGMPRVRHALAKAARASVQAMAATVQVRHMELQLRNGRVIRSLSNGHWYRVDGMTGTVWVDGKSVPEGLLPWFTALFLGRGGQHRAEGYGIVRMRGRRLEWGDE